jgi:hypothetical protein
MPTFFPLLHGFPGSFLDGSGKLTKNPGTKRGLTLKGIYIIIFPGFCPCYGHLKINRGEVDEL